MAIAAHDYDLSITRIQGDANVAEAERLYEVVSSRHGLLKRNPIIDVIEGTAAVCVSHQAQLGCDFLLSCKHPGVEQRRLTVALR